ncbi:hypothetical protein LTR15_008455 [Elasticomyces elasticus]|nr:hypothetical protein LTR15_008455 [Elasticomyces elasticus]
MATMEEDPQMALNSVPKEITLAEDGDVIMILREKRFRVSSVVLSLASPVFKTMFGPNFLEGQAPRSAEQPKEIKLEDGYSLEMLLALMHHFDLDTLRGLDEDLYADTPLLVGCIAIAFDKYCCTQALGLSVEALLRRSANNAVIDDESVEGRFNMYAHTAASAYLIGSKTLFAEATRYMVLEGLKPFSELADVMFYRIIPISVLLGLEEQRTEARNAFISSFSGMTDRGCPFQKCSATSESTTFPKDMKRVLKDWPPLWTTASLRSVLHDMDGAGDIALGDETSCNHRGHSKIAGNTVKRVCDNVRFMICGMCYDCARQDKMQSRCEHKEELRSRASHRAFD